MKWLTCLLICRTQGYRKLYDVYVLCMQTPACIKNLTFLLPTAKGERCVGAKLSAAVSPQCCSIIHTWKKDVQGKYASV